MIEYINFLSIRGYREDLPKCQQNLHWLNLHSFLVSKVQKRYVIDLVLDRLAIDYDVPDEIEIVDSTGKPENKESATDATLRHI